MYTYERSHDERSDRFCCPALAMEALGNQEENAPVMDNQILYGGTQMRSLYTAPWEVEGDGVRARKRGKWEKEERTKYKPHST